MDDRRTHSRMAERSLAQKAMCSSKEKRNAGLICFKGPLNTK
jgi:hypothetical protein